MSAASVPDMSTSGGGGSPKRAKEVGFGAAVRTVSGRHLVDTKGSDDGDDGVYDAPHSSGSDDHSVEGIHTEQDLDDLVKSVS